VSQPTVEIVDVSPEMAEQWLSRNSNNRNPRGEMIASNARDMTNGSWVLNGETSRSPQPVSCSTVSTASTPSWTRA
jgi:hypothetical protein